MIPLSRTASLLAARTGLALVLLSLAGFVVWTADDLLGQTPPAKKKPRVEEEEETAPKKPKRKVIQVPEEESPKTKAEPTRPAVPSANGDLNQLKDQTKHPALKALFSSLAVPHDRVLYKRTGVTNSGENIRREEIIKPTSLYLGDDPGRYHEDLKFTQLSTDKLEEIRSYSPILKSLEAVRPYEKIAQDKVRAFLREPYDTREPDDRLYLSRYDMLDAAEKVLKAVLLWHDSARQTGKRKGDGWENVEKELRKQLLDDVLLEQMKIYAQAKNWDRVLEMTHRLAVTYTDTNERQSIFRPVADLIQGALKKDPTVSEKTRQDACKRLLDLDREFPNNPALRPIRDTLRAEAQSWLDAAKEALKEKDSKKANEYQLRAQQIWPQLEGLQSFRSELHREHPILRVGVRGPLPKYFSPAWAYTDNERRAVEMLFESLVKLVPDASGGYGYCCGLSESYPQVVPLGRQFKLPREAVWTDRRPLNSTDIEVSLGLFRRGMGVGRSRVWGDLLARKEQMNDPFQVTLRLKQGFLDPLSMMTFKILPRDREVTTAEFAQNPVTSGPFRLDRSRQSDEMQRECLFFLANPDYSRRAGKHDAPHIQEVRFYSYAGDTLADDLRRGKLDLVLDLTAKETEELLNKQKVDPLPIEISFPSANASNRRIYFLAVNTRKLEDANLRQALSYAIDRETLLNKHFRASLKAPLHKALSGPFPAGSWACKPADGNAGNKSSRPLFDRDAAKTQAQQKAVLDAVKAGPLKLKYPDDNPALDDAMKELCSQVEDLTGVVLEPTPLPPHLLREDVELTNYDLAYYHYDFPDKIYWLAPLFGPPPGKEDGNNIFKFNNVTLTRLLEDTKSYRDFAMVRKFQWQTQEELNKQMPFIPLWQLDPLLVYRSEVKPDGLDPLLVFTNIEDWRIMHK
ncbi:MAG: ABC transporter substrate-binding protein [Gemmataceae bacterium]